MQLTLGEEIAKLREKVEALNEDFLAGIFKAVLKEDYDRRESKYFKYFDSKFKHLETVINERPDQLTVLSLGQLSLEDRPVQHKVPELQPPLTHKAVSAEPVMYHNTEDKLAKAFRTFTVEFGYEDTPLLRELI